MSAYVRHVPAIVIRIRFLFVHCTPWTRDKTQFYHTIVVDGIVSFPNQMNTFDCNPLSRFCFVYCTCFFFSMWMGDTHSKCKTHNRKPRQTTSVLRFAWFCMVQNILNLTFHGYQWLSCSHQHADMALAGARHGRGWLRCFLRPVPRIFEKHLPGLCQLISQPGVMGHKPNLREIVNCMYIYIYVNYIQ